MNCKKGDLAFVVRAPAAAFLRPGAIVRCIEYVDGPTISIAADGTARGVWGYWRVEFRGSEINPCTGYIWAKSDCDLRPIRDPGDDAVDEVLVRLGKPVGQPQTVEG